MSSRPSVTGEQACRVLEKFSFLRKKKTSGSHFIMVHGESKRIVPVPVHKEQTLPKGTLKSVIKLSGIPESDSFDAL